MPKLASKLSSKLPSLAKTVKSVVAPREPLWKGPCDEGPMGGITQSLLGRLISCKERARLYLIEGLKPHESFSSRMEFGNIWHAAEESLAYQGQIAPALVAARNYAIGLVKRYREAGVEIDKWLKVNNVQFPIYVEYWAKHPDVKDRKPISQEEVFNVPYKLPSGRVVRLRGKFDSVDLVNKGIYLQENKSKGEIDKEKLQRDLPWDLQTNLYLTALSRHRDNDGDGYVEGDLRRKFPIKGVRYNVIRRPLGSRGKHNIKQRMGRKTKAGIKGAETSEEFYTRLGKVIEDNPKDFFVRFKMEVSPADLKRFQDQCLNPILENAVDDYEWWGYCNKTGEGVFNYLLRQQVFPQHQARHFIFPQNVWNPALEGRQGDYDQFIQSGSTQGLSRVSTLFGELQ